MRILLLTLALLFSTAVQAERYFTIVRMPHPFDIDSIPANVQAAFIEKGLKGVHTTWVDGVPTWNKMPGTRIYQGKRLVLFEVQADEVDIQTLLDANGLASMEMVAYRTENCYPDPASTDENPLPNRPDYSRKPSTADLIGWMNDESIYNPADPDNPTIQRPTVLRLNHVDSHATGAVCNKWTVVN